MAEPTPVRNTPPVQPAPPPQARPVERAGERPEASAPSLSFRAMLDDLAARARDLSLESRRELSRAELSDAVEDARETLDRALALQAQLLAAYREARQRAQVERPSE